MRALAVALALAGLLALAASAPASTPWRYEHEYRHGTLKWRYELWRHRVLRVQRGGVGPDLVRWRRPLHGTLRPARFRHRVRVVIGRYRAAVAANRPPPWRSVSSTAYCLGGTMANGQRVYAGAVAVNFLPLGTKVTVSSAPYANRHYIVADRIGWGTELDFWTASCADARAWGRRQVRVRVGWW